MGSYDILIYLKEGMWILIDYLNAMLLKHDGFTKKDNVKGSIK